MEKYFYLATYLILPFTAVNKVTNLFIHLLPLVVNSLFISESLAQGQAWGS